jgi:flagellar basal-body rod protein FlgB
MTGIFGSSGQRALEGRLAQLIAQQDVVAQQVANVNTPGYQAQGAQAFATQLQAQLTAQLGGTAVPAPGSVPGQTPAPALLSSSTLGAITPDGNGVGFDATMVNLAKTDLNYQAVTRQLQLNFTNVSIAIDRGGA